MRVLGKAALCALGLLLSSCGVGNHAPPFANLCYEPFSRGAAVAIALREWRLWGSGYNDNPAYVQRAATMPEREQGLWQRVGEYWWEGMNSNIPMARWTGKHNAKGQVFPVAVNGDYAWSAAFISYVMRIAGAGPRFPYAPYHAYYINYAAQPYREGKLLVAENPLDYAPHLGDLVCFARGGAASLTFKDLPTKGYFPSHCDIVTGRGVGVLLVVGGNIDDSVLMTRLPINAQGMLIPDGETHGTGEGSLYEPQEEIEPTSHQNDLPLLHNDLVKKQERVLVVLRVLYAQN